MRLFNCIITTYTCYPFGDSDYNKLKPKLIQVNNDNLSEDKIKERILKKLKLSTIHTEIVGESHVVDIKLEPILVI